MCQHEKSYENGSVKSIYFEEGLFGFENFKEFIPVAVEEDSDAILMLKSTEEDGPSFVLMNPFFLKEDYAPDIAQEDLNSLGEATKQDYLCYVICVARTPIETSTVNLRCPIVINTATRKGRQVILGRGEYGFRHPLAEFIGKENK